MMIMTKKKAWTLADLVAKIKGWQENPATTYRPVDILHDHAEDILRLVEVERASREVMAVLDRFGEWEDSRCYYYNGTAATELQSPMQALASALNPSRDSGDSNA